MKLPTSLALTGAITILAASPVPRAQPARTLESLPFAPRHYICHRTATPVRIDGRLDEWDRVPMSEPFIDIEGEVRPKPRLQTRMRMLWDDQYLYVAADLEEPDVWGTLTERDSVIFHDNDFEMFIDPDGDTHNYYELEINPLNTVWDLMLPRPYRDGGKAIDSWDIIGLKTAVAVRGTINRAGDRDEGWRVEIAMPWTVLEEATPDERAPLPGEQWRINFSRVEWNLDVKDGQYVKRTDAKGNLLPEHNWVWSPQGAVAMHMPERWGIVQFSGRPAGGGEEPFVESPDTAVRWALRRLYYRQVDYRKAHGRYARSLEDLDAANIVAGGQPFRPQLSAGDDWYVLTAMAPSGGRVHLRDDGRVWLDSK